MGEGAFLLTGSGGTALPKELWSMSPKATASLLHVPFSPCRTLGKLPSGWGGAGGRRGEGEMLNIPVHKTEIFLFFLEMPYACLLYTSDAADEHRDV